MATNSLTTGANRSCSAESGISTIAERAPQPAIHWSELNTQQIVEAAGAAKFDRRSLINMLVSAAAISATASPVLAGQPDAAIISAADRLHQLKPIYDAAQARWDETFAEFQARRPERSAALKWRPDGLNVRCFGRGRWLDPTDLKGQRGVEQVIWKYVGPGDAMATEMWNDELGCPNDEFQHLFESRPAPALERRLNEALEAQDIYDAKCRALKAEIGLDVAETHLNELYFKQIEPLQKEAVNSEATTLAGLRATSAN